MLTECQRAQHKKERTLSSDEARRAIYIDFEGFTDKPPCLVGIAIEDRFEQIVLDERLTLAAQSKGLRLMDGGEFAASLLDRAIIESRRIIAFSSHEKSVLKNFHRTEVDAVYADARMIAKKLRKQFSYPVGEPPRDLKSYLSYIDFERGDYLGLRKSTSRLRAVIDMLDKKQDYDLLTATVKAKWTKLLEHNRIDVLGMRALVLMATS
jgi:hypothetical protein